MEKRLIPAEVLGIIGGFIIASFLGLSFYTVILFPALIVVLIISVGGSQGGKAVCIGLLLFLSYGTYFADTFVYVIRSSLLALFGISLLLLFSSFYSHENLKRESPVFLRIITALFFIVAISVQIYEWSLDWIWVVFVRSEPLFHYPYQIYIYHILPISLYALLVTFLIFGNRFAFYIITPIALVLTLLLATDNILGFFRGHVLPAEFGSYVNPPFFGYYFREDKAFLLFIWASLSMTLLFFPLYKKKPKGEQNEGIS